MASSASTVVDGVRKVRYKLSHGRRTRTVELDGREAELLGNLRVLNLLGVLEREALDTLSHVRAARNSRAASESLELDIGDDTVFVDTNLEFHHVATTTVTVSDDGGKDKGNLRTLVHRRDQYRHPCPSLA
jgi:hypothetical protein